MSEDNSWVFDSLVCFLHGPVWNAPLQTFIEEKSLIFDPNLQQDETNAEYLKIHEEYKNLVDYMLGSFMEEMQITPEQFEMACLEGRNQQQPDNPFNFHQGLFQQIWAANDIKIFIRMMTQRNVELQLQALDLIERRQNSTSLDEDPPNNTGQASQHNESVEEKEIITEEEISKVVEKELESPEILHPNESEEQGKFQRLNLFFDNPKINPEDVKMRQEYLRSQRDRILEIKKKARAKQLNETAKKNGRPSSAQVAQKFLEGDVDEVAQHTDRNEASIQLRRTLAKRLRAEVVEHQ